MMKILALNFKMNLNYEDIKEYKKNIEGKINNKNVILFPPSLFLPCLISDEYSFGTQNISEFDNGAHTGEISASQLKSLGGTYTLVGHSERRSEQGELDSKLNLKIKKALEKDLKVILCVGETKVERETGKTNEVIERELKNGLDGIEKIEDVIIAYEPIWSIGTGLIPSKEDIIATTNFIIETVDKMFNYKIKVLYGGSVNDKNISELSEIDVVSGFLVGGASLDVNKVFKMKEVIEK